MNYPGGAIGEYSVRAKELNQSFIGQEFGLHLNGYVLYGRIGAVRVYERHVLLTLADVPGEDIHLLSDQEIYFSSAQKEDQVGHYLNEFRNYLRKKQPEFTGA